MSALEGRRALVTGAGVGIGQGIALELARQGAAVAVHYYADSVAGGQETVAAIQESGGKAIPIEADLTAVAACRRAVDEAAAALGGLDVLINNAGVTVERPFQETTEENFNLMFGLNVRGYFFMCAAGAVPHARPGRRQHCQYLIRARLCRLPVPCGICRHKRRCQCSDPHAGSRACAVACPGEYDWTGFDRSTPLF